MVKHISQMSVALLLLCSIFSISALGNYETDDASFVIRVEDNLLTAKVKEIPLRKVLKEVENLLAIKATYLFSGNALIVAEFSGLPIEKGLRRLLQDYNLAFEYDPEGSKSGAPFIRKVFILSRKASTADLAKESPLQPQFPRGTSLEDLRRSVKDKDPEIREYAVEEIGKLNDEDAIELLKGVLLTDENEYVRLCAVDALGSMKSSEAINTLKEALKDESVDVRVNVADVLGVMRSEDAIEPLVVALKDEDEDVRERAMDALGMIGGDRATKAREKALAEEEGKRSAMDVNINRNE
ncbi:MAG: HEAT repeat domain-containing protein [Candidatus Scalindua sp. AMX11]|nr:MAG: HEAT repeat domain-containing protein [Candidatus Scalindua sp.]NOG83645.1 HEAT repeat domain-containing protein [Planctomycetota bacterium]RZV63224.1 MAG: HEAT repeat domain-containing protein [Candidatus Scalindua sp. SCAELEC01]TDE63403.1 MAG: HEAT repeat domain-containing protein [Candidatus Scalindua sp. AMX11]GJQ57340.1 MAG: hypothetical protein SCALA701_01410 [Candidatus Scalindua sp.]